MNDPSADAVATYAGHVLIAMPALSGDHFSRSVVYICSHTEERGSMGIVVNRPIETPRFEDLLKQLDILPTPPARRIELCSGGPIDDARGFVLHSTDWTGDGSLLVDSQVALTASLDVLKALAEGGGPRQGMLALGYAGWEPGQLDREMRDNAWLVAPARDDLLFDAAHATKWRRALASLRIDPLALSPVAGHA